MSGDLLQRIQTLQFKNKNEAETLLKSFLHEIYSTDVEKVELRPLAVSLNSFNGYITLSGGKRLFFKTHTEPDTVISEYYNAGRLAEAGYPIIRPIFSSTDVGKQLLIYEVINSISVFDAAWMIERGDKSFFPDLSAAQQQSDRQLFDLYRRSFSSQTSNEANKSPIHQLFYHRLTGGRLTRFYGQPETGDYPQIKLPMGTYSMEEIRNTHWVVNDQVYEDTIEQIIHRAVKLLNPNVGGISVIGHGDAHNGNVFFQQDTTPPTLLYFDPAFAGRHSPLLDLTKPLFHNVFAMWMYFPKIKLDSLHIQMERRGQSIVVRHDYSLNPVREMFLESKLNHVVTPLFRKLREESLLPDNWREYLKTALFCCPFLTMNLTDSQKFPPEISLLGLAMAVEMGSESINKRSKIDQILDTI
ncbi:MAG: hypothetical protein GC179_02805 [Anaerolineaceae bacterium]|nr:hypothetical protein [Anaerolineaceae bacterium]